MQNNKQNDLNFQNILYIQVYSVIPYCSVNSSRTVYRVFYSAGLKENEAKLDITDFVDPNDAQYSAGLRDRALILDRAITRQETFVPCSVQSASVDDKVDGVNSNLVMFCLNVLFNK